MSQSTVQPENHAPGVCPGEGLGLGAGWGWMGGRDLTMDLDTEVEPVRGRHRGLVS